jgi:hypothetical protein
MIFSRLDKLNVHKVDLVIHDIGSMVGYAPGAALGHHGSPSSRKG